MDNSEEQKSPIEDFLGLPFDGTEDPTFTEWLEATDKSKEFYQWVIDERKRVAAHSIRKAIKYLKTTSAVTLVGRGGAYELLEAYIKKFEDNK